MFELLRRRLRGLHGQVGRTKATDERVFEKIGDRTSSKRSKFAHAKKAGLNLKLYFIWDQDEEVEADRMLKRHNEKQLVVEFHFVFELADLL